MLLWWNIRIILFMFKDKSIECWDSVENLHAFTSMMWWYSSKLWMNICLTYAAFLIFWQLIIYLLTLARFSSIIHLSICWDNMSIRSICLSIRTKSKSFLNLFFRKVWMILKHIWVSQIDFAIILEITSWNSNFYKIKRRLYWKIHSNQKMHEKLSQQKPSFWNLRMMNWILFMKFSRIFFNQISYDILISSDSCSWIWTRSTKRLMSWFITLIRRQILISLILINFRHENQLSSFCFSVVCWTLQNQDIDSRNLKWSIWSESFAKFVI